MRRYKVSMTYKQELRPLVGSVMELYAINGNVAAQGVANLVGMERSTIVCVEKVEEVVVCQKI